MADRALGNPLGNPLGLARVVGERGARIVRIQSGMITTSSLTATISFDEVSLSSAVLITRSTGEGNNSYCRFALSEINKDSAVFQRASQGDGTLEWSIIEFDGVKKVHRFDDEFTAGSSNNAGSGYRDIVVPDAVNKSKCIVFIESKTSLSLSSELASNIVWSRTTYASDPHKFRMIRRMPDIMPNVSYHAQILELE